MIYDGMESWQAKIVCLCGLMVAMVGYLTLYLIKHYPQDWPDGIHHKWGYPVVVGKLMGWSNLVSGAVLVVIYFYRVIYG